MSLVSLVDEIRKYMENNMTIEPRCIHTLIDTLCKQNSVNDSPVDFLTITGTSILFQGHAYKYEKRVLDLVVSFATESAEFFCIYRIWENENGGYIEDEIFCPALSIEQRRHVLGSLREHIAMYEDTSDCEFIAMLEEKLISDWNG